MTIYLADKNGKETGRIYPRPPAQPLDSSMGENVPWTLREKVAVGIFCFALSLVLAMAALAALGLLPAWMY